MVRAEASISGLLTRREWLMYPGERAALEGLLAALKPALAVEIGTYRGGSLERISAHSRAVHAFDLKRYPELTNERFPNVTFHFGDSHEILPRVLQQLATTGANVDFAFVDGDHSAQGVRQDLEDLLSSPSTARTVILLHDTLHQQVRAGLEQFDYSAFDKVRFVDLDFVPGRVMSGGAQKDNLLAGLALIVTDLEEREEWAWPAAYATPDVYAAFASAIMVDGQTSSRVGYQQVMKLERRVTEQRNLVMLMERSWSWRLTRPLRAARRLLGGRP